ncbi:hypothetical protein HMPREF2779_06760 [Rothia sp. HMSC069C03]|nr:hypothetical protein HMPREF2779_06760 [Rothia sp. HMSC069C03]OHQ18431.1 hypothetical protein HMPREF2605_00565 [Rothia sp. HMSC065C03]
MDDQFILFALLTDWSYSSVLVLVLSLQLPVVLAAQRIPSMSRILIYWLLTTRAMRKRKKKNRICSRRVNSLL